MGRRGPFLAALLLCCSLSSNASAEIQLSFQNGRVTIVAADVTVAQILALWALVGRATAVNLDRMPGVPISIELRDVPEAQALDTLLREYAGYIAFLRSPAGASDVSLFERVEVMPALAMPKLPVDPKAVRPAPQQVIVSAPDAEDETELDYSWIPEPPPPAPVRR